MLLPCCIFFYLLTCVNNVLLDAIKMSYVLCLSTWTPNLSGGAPHFIMCLCLQSRKDVSCSLVIPYR